MRLAVLALLLLTACSRPLTRGESAFATSLFGPQLQTENVSVASFPALTSLTQSRPARPRVACRERIWPAPVARHETVETFTAAFVTFNRINMADKLFAKDYLPQYPKRLSLPAAMLIGHELTHVWQWQNRRRTGYSLWKAAREHRPGTDPYLLDLKTRNAFLDFPYEQQGAIVEEYVCCLNLDPQGPRTHRLHAMLASAFPVRAIADRLKGVNVVLPWKGARTRGICS